MVFLLGKRVGFAWFVRDRANSHVTSVSIPLYAPDMRTTDAQLYQMAGFSLFAWARLSGYDG
jgi:hypothetical protein